MKLSNHQYPLHYTKNGFTAESFSRTAANFVDKITQYAPFVDKKYHFVDKITQYAPFVDKKYHFVDKQQWVVDDSQSQRATIRIANHVAMSLLITQFVTNQDRRAVE
jgi:hypothetical protein